MLVALLVALGVGLVVVVAVAVVVIGRRWWLRRRPGGFAGAIGVPGGEAGGLSPKWKHGSGRWAGGIGRENHPRTACRHLRSSW
ncbi:MAG TPA: hypothetical protein VF256_10385 [Streptosporangiaceae bacterium]